MYYDLFQTHYPAISLRLGSWCTQVRFADRGGTAMLHSSVGSGIRSKFESNEELKNGTEVSTASSEGRNAKLSFQPFIFGKGY